MSYHDYLMSRAVEGQDFPFYALVMALYRQADTDNQRRIEAAWPKVVAELKARYNAPGGVLEEDTLRLPGGKLEIKPVFVDMTEAPPMSPEEEEAAIDDLFDRSEWPPRE